MNIKTKEFNMNKLKKLGLTALGTSFAEGKLNMSFPQELRNKITSKYNIFCIYLFYKVFNP